MFFEGEITRGLYGIEIDHNPCINGIIDPKISKPSFDVWRK